MIVQHIVMWQFKPDASAEARQQTIDEMLGLREACVHPQTAKPYIKASMGGSEMSIEGMQDGISHVFVVEFASVADRDYYVRHDAAHHAFVQTRLLAPDAPIQRAIVVDFAPGRFGQPA